MFLSSSSSKLNRHIRLLRLPTSQSEQYTYNRQQVMIFCPQLQFYAHITFFDSIDNILIPQLCIDIRAMSMIQESDDMLISGLKQFIVLPKEIVHLKDVKMEEMFMIVVEFLAHMGDDVQTLSKLKPQRFRTITKINQALQHHLACDLQFNDLMNPNTTFIRKLMLLLINRLSGEEVHPQKVSKNVQLKSNDNNTAKLYTQWLKRQWVHPYFIKQIPNNRAYAKPLTIDKTLLRRDITTQLGDKWLIGNCSAVLEQAICKQRIKQAKLEAQEGITIKANQQTVNRQKLIFSNQEDWVQDSTYLRKIKKKLQTTQQQLTIKTQQSSVFKQQVQKKVQSHQENIVHLQKPVVGLKSRNDSYQERIQAIIQELKTKKKNVKKIHQKKQQIDEQIIANEQSIAKQKEELIQLKKRVQKRQILLLTIESQKNVEQQVNKLNKQIKQLKEVGMTQVQYAQCEIKQMQERGMQRMQILKDLKMKLNKLEAQYLQVCEQLQQREQLRKKVKVPKMGISRLQYIKKISTLEVQWRQTVKQIKKIRKNLQDLRTKSTNSMKLTSRIQTEIQNVINADMHNNSDIQNKNLKKLFMQCRQAFQKTIETLQNINEIKYQTEEYEINVHKMTGKNYQANTQKLKVILEDLKKQVNQLKKTQK